MLSNQRLYLVQCIDQYLIFAALSTVKVCRVCSYFSAANFYKWASFTEITVINQRVTGVMGWKQGFRIHSFNSFFAMEPLHFSE